MHKTTNKRRVNRLRRKLAIVFDHDHTRPAHTNDLSKTGLSISSDYVAVPGTSVEGTITLSADTSVHFSAFVVWARKVDARSALTGTSRMGLKFVESPGSAYEAYLNDALAQLKPPRVTPTPRKADHLGDVVAGQPPVAAHKDGSELRPVEWPVSPVGMTGRVSSTVSARDLAAGLRFPGGLSPVRLAEWIDEASRRCIQSVMPDAMASVCVGLSMTVTHRPAVEVGTKVAINAKLTLVTAQGRTLAFEVRVDDGQRELATGKIARILIDRD